MPYLFTWDNIAASRQLKEVEKQYLQDVNAVNALYKEERKEIFTDRFKLINNLFENRQVITDTTVTNYFERLLALIVNANRQWNFSKIRLLISCSYVPNASGWGEGTLVYNAGLFSRLSNEAQVAFVLCHELSHYLLNHSGKQLDEYLSSVYSDEAQRRLQALNKQEYNKGAELKALAEKMAFGSRRHSRTHELQADSLAMVLMYKAGFDLYEAVNCLSALDSMDTDKYNLPLKLEQRFSTETFTFRTAWIKKQTSLSVMAGKLDKTDSIKADSLKTHPDIPFRVTTARTMVQNVGGNKFLVSQKTFFQLVNDFDFNIINYCYNSKKLTRALYYSLEMLDSFPENAWLYTMIGNCLAGMYHYQQLHHLSDVSDHPSVVYSESYNSLLRMINNVRLDDLGAILNAWVQNNGSRFENDEGFMALQVQNAAISNPAQKAALSSRYRQLYPNGKLLINVE